MSSVAVLTARTVMNKAAALMNDVNRSVYTYSIQVPYLQTAMQELQEYFELHNVSVTGKRSAVIEVDAGISEIGYDPIDGLPGLPDDMIEPIKVWERTRGISPFVPMTKVSSISYDGTPVSRFGGFIWEGQKITFPISSQNNDIKIEYLRQLFTEILNENSSINILNARTFLEFRTAGLLIEFVEHGDPTSMNGYASTAMDRVTGITVKGKQSIMTRRRPFRSGYR